ncbi:MAG: flagellar hook-basal body complex protein FliE [Phycisphaerales bacterium]|jgi:flagellar hook-basal body complex protein FliE|nr:flagellar hook-basal body complex protein FliE [Phycisphaerales bacterium]
MADPLGFINQSAAARSIQPRGLSSHSGQQDGSSFKDVLLDNLKEVNNLQQDATKAMEDLQTGKRSDLEGVILATQKADTAFQMLQALRNKVMEAYEEVKQTRV